MTQLAEAADLARELDAVRENYNGVRLHAGIGYVTRTTNTTAGQTRSARPAATGSPQHAPHA